MSFFAVLLLLKVRHLYQMMTAVVVVLLTFATMARPEGGCTIILLSSPYENIAIALLYNRVYNN